MMSRSLLPQVSVLCCFLLLDAQDDDTSAAASALDELEVAEDYEVDDGDEE